DLGLLTEEQLTCLYRRLTIPWAVSSPDLVVAILKALPSIGGESALLLVERLAAYPPFFPNARRIKEATRATQAVLEQRLLPEQSALETGGDEAECQILDLTDSE